MRIVTELPRRVRELRHAEIPMADGVRLAARLWLPEDAEDRPVPAVLEYIPYRHNDVTNRRDSIAHPYMAGHGYACVRVDLRGSGNSEGVLTDEYLSQELDDGVAVIEWLARQPWCSGRVGMVGISWGGFNALQIATRRPPALGAIVTVCSTDDRYADDVHHMGGCLLGDNLSWASVMFAYNASPPDPAAVGGRWRELWRRRLEGSGLWLETWLRHQRRDAYWRHGSVCEDYGAIGCPVLAVSGWADGYSNAVFRLVAHLEAPCRGLIGPWSHKYPHLGEPGPAIGFLQEAVRWWDHWLKGRDTGVMDEPALRVWMQDSVPPTTRYRRRPGRWVAEPAWPSPHVEERFWRLAPARLIPAGEAGPCPEAEQAEPPLTLRSPLSVGLFAGKWCSYSAPPDLPHDQREEDGGALVFDSAPLDERMEILGAPRVDLDLAADKPVAMVAVRLSDLAPDDKATRVTYGLLNLTHRDGAQHPRPLEPGRRYRVTVKLNDVAQSFPAGHRIRVALSTSYWPLAWPPPEPVRLTLFAGAGRLMLPERPPRPEDAALRPFGEPEGAPPVTRTVLEAGRHAWTVIRDLANDVSTLEVVKDDGRFRIEPADLEMRLSAAERYSFWDDDFDSVRGETRAEWEFRRGDWRVRTSTRTRLGSTASHFLLQADLDAFEGDTRVHCHSWDKKIPRDFV